MTQLSHTKQIKRVLIAGTFDIIHPGHIALIQEAAKLGQVIVIVAKDSTVKRIRNRPPVIPEDQRLAVIQSIKEVSSARLGNENPNLFLIVRDVKPDIVLLGPNQDVTKVSLEEWVRKQDLPVSIRRMRTMYNLSPLSSTTAIIQRILELVKSGKLKAHDPMD